MEHETCMDTKVDGWLSKALQIHASTQGPQGDPNMSTIRLMAVVGLLCIPGMTMGSPSAPELYFPGLITKEQSHHRVLIARISHVADWKIPALDGGCKGDIIYQLRFIAVKFI